MGLSPVRLTSGAEMLVVDCFSSFFSEVGDFKVIVPTPFGSNPSGPAITKKDRPVSEIALSIDWDLNPFGG
jgi:hypothetical protein